jgi:ribosomal protein S18 acetylase RimI-like enzyme
MNIRSGSFDEIVTLHNQIEELLPISDSCYFSERIADKNSLLLVAEIDSVLVGYKLGYWLDDNCFYSWLGGVHPDCRKQGIAKALLLEQERHVREMGTKEIRVKSMNQYRSMLLLLIAQGYAITGVHVNAQDKEKIHFAKKLV